MDLDRGTLARIDRKLLAGLGDDEAYLTLRAPAIATKWSTWNRSRDSVAISMGRAVTMLIDRELISVLGDITGDEPPVFAQRATDELTILESKIADRERVVDTDHQRMREWRERLRRREDELKAPEQRAELVSKLTSRQRGERSSTPSMLRPARRRPRNALVERQTPSVRLHSGEGPGYVGCDVGVWR